MTVHCSRPAARVLIALSLGVSIGAVTLAGSSLPAIASSTSPGPLNLDPFLTVQDKSLDCEAAALAAAFAARNVPVSTGNTTLQNWIFNQLPVDRRNAINTRGAITWGDPYTGFVGNVNRSEGFAGGDGYGVYYQPIADVVSKVGHSVSAEHRVDHRRYRN